MDLTLAPERRGRRVPARLATALLSPAVLAVAALLALLAVLTGCSSGSDGSSGSSTADVGDSSAQAPGAYSAEPAAPRKAGDAAEGADAGGTADSAGSTGSAGTTAVRTTLTKPAIIATGQVSLEAKDVDDARAAVRRVIDAQQGTVAEQETATGDDGKASSLRIVIKVPADRFDAATAALEKVGTLLDSTSNTEDVSAEVVDTDARVSAQRRSVARIEALLSRANSIGEVVSIEAQLSQRQADLDALVSQQRYLATQTAMSTITVEVQRTGRDSGRADDDRDGFLGGLASGWDAFVDGAAGAATAVGFLLPWAVLLGVLTTPLWLLRRRRRGAGAAAAA